MLKILKLKYGDLVSITGGGGKTTTMYHLSEKLEEASVKNIITTTTKIMLPESSHYKKIVLSNDLNEIIEKIEKYREFSPVLVASKFIKKRKLNGISENYLDEIYEEISKNRVILVEADGSKGKEIKGHRKFEPVVSKKTTILIPVIGSKIIGKKLVEENVHCAEIFSELVNRPIGSTINSDFIVSLFKNKNGYLKVATDKMRIVPFISSLRYENIEVGEEIARKLIENVEKIENVVIGNIGKDNWFKNIV